MLPLSADELRYVPSDNFAMDCSLLDTPSYFRPDSKIEQNFSFSTVSRINDMEPHDRGEEPKPSACIIRKQRTYPFSVSTGPKFVRLYFVPISYSGLKVSKALFSVSIGQYTLLTTSESSYYELNSDAGYFVREFCIITDGQILNVTFTPSSKISGAYAFVNRIEIVSMPSNLYIQENVPLPLLGRPSHYSMENSTALEMMHRSSSLTPAYAAPKKVYASARTVWDTFAGNHSARWSFPVDFGFYYLVRLHFCEISSRIHQDGERVFHVYINNQTAEDHADIFHWSHGVGIPIYRDYIINFSEPGEGIKHLSITIGSKNGSSATYEVPILNGLEIFKLSDHSNNLAGPIHSDSIVSTFKDRENFKLGQSSGNYRIFSIDEIKSATNNFSDTLLIGTGGFGKVYRGSIDYGSTSVAIKRANPSSHQGLKEFQTEITMLSGLRHHHLVSLIGYSMEKKEMILVYDYMAHGTLRDHLYKTQKPPLPWKQRLKICIGAARGLHYLHTVEENKEEEEYEKASLAQWALRYCQMGILDQIVDPYLKGKIAPECFRTFTDIASKCLADKGSGRPFMGDVLCNLELAMQQQNAADLGGEGYKRG
ncbi:hypothetical protein GH714_029769 [Hevea brasiliensis]|uniref:Protein kinase domain-containing protein n=1 Tax=Hevea brasiliensis TaxID=3981 RepID=A0A6A6N7U8_HEVBR|nr:hypothetical protein GH714_029769 [Hevea brasiliensis]